MNIFSVRENDVLRDKKWWLFLKYARIFQYIPFIEFAFGAGSMALNTAHEESDFDVIIGVRQGRIFTARFFAVLLFGLCGIRRSRIDHKGMAKNKICLNHFVTKNTYKLSPPYTDYSKKLYAQIVPLYGEKEKFREFYLANNWLNENLVYENDMRHKLFRPKWPASIMMFLGGGFIGDKIENILKYFELKRMRLNLNKTNIGYNSRIKFLDEELEFHPNPK